MKIPSRPLTRSRRLIARESMVAHCDFDRCDDRFANIEMAIASSFDFPNRESRFRGIRDRYWERVGRAECRENS